MPAHDWSRVGSGVFHDFDGSWITELKKALNGGLLPADYYALAEQVAGETGPDVLALKKPGQPSGAGPAGLPGATTIAEAPPRVSITASAEEADLYALERRSLVIRHASGDEVVAMIEIVSRGN